MEAGPNPQGPLLDEGEKKEPQSDEYRFPDTFPRPMREYARKNRFWDATEEAVQIITIRDCNNNSLLVQADVTLIHKNHYWIKGKIQPQSEEYRFPDTFPRTMREYARKNQL